jgi:5-methylcytosine-specific restriction endonuclease McrA
MCTTTFDLELALRDYVTHLDPATPAADAVSVVRELARLARIATAGIMRLAARAGEHTAWRDEHHPDPGSWLADLIGLSTFDGRRLHHASHHQDVCTLTWEQLTAGNIPPLKAVEVIHAAVAAATARAQHATATAADDDAAAADAAAGGDDGPSDDVGQAPADVEAELLDLASRRTGTLYRLRNERARYEAAARDQDQQADHLHTSRDLSYRPYPDGASGGAWRLPPLHDATIRHIIDAEADRLAKDYRARGLPIPNRGALRADAFLHLLTGRLPQPPPSPQPPPARATRSRRRPTPARPTTRTGRRPGPADTAPPVSTPAPAADADAGVDAGALPLDIEPDPTLTHPLLRPHLPITEIVVRVDGEALHRGILLAGEVCQIQGTGPIPIATAFELVAHGLLDILVHHHGRPLWVACLGAQARQPFYPQGGRPPRPPRQRTRILLRIQADTPLGATRTHLLRLLPEAVVDLYERNKRDPWAYNLDIRRYPRPLLIAHRELHPTCLDCGTDLWLERDHELALALGGRTTLANLTGRCPRCHRTKTRRDTPHTTRRRRQRGKRKPTPVAAEGP